MLLVYQPRKSGHTKLSTWPHFLSTSHSWYSCLKSFRFCHLSSSIYTGGKKLLYITKWFSFFSSYLMNTNLKNKKFMYERGGMRVQKERKNTPTKTIAKGCYILYSSRTTFVYEKPKTSATKKKEKEKLKK